MKFELTQSFIGDLARLSHAERELVRGRLPDFVAACDRFATDPAAKWPSSLRVRDVESAPGVMEVTFSFAGPDIRATFEWVRIDSELAVRWRPHRRPSRLPEALIAGVLGAAVSTSAPLDS